MITQRVRGVVVAASLAVTGCAATDRPPAAPAPSPTPLVARPLPSSSPGLRDELLLVADALDRPGDGARERHDRLQACIRLARLRAHAAADAKGIAGTAQVKELARADRACPTDQADAARIVRDAVAAIG